MMKISQNMSDCQQILDYLHGNLILLQSGGKIPVDQNWTRAPSRINGDARGYLDLGFNLGYRIDSGHLIIDVDPRNGGEESFLLLPAAVQTLPRTTQTPGGGFHIYTKLPDGTDPKSLRSSLPDLPGIDFLHQGKQVVVPGSSLNDQLSWTLDPGAAFPPPETPADLLELLKRPERTVEPVDLESYLSVFELDLILSMIPVDKYRSNDSWLQLAMACHHATDGQGLSAFLAWSLTDPQYSDQGEIIARRWESMATSNTPAPITIRTLIKELGRFAPVPSWLSLRAGLQTSPAEFFEALDREEEAARSAFDALSARIDATGDHLQLLTSVAAAVGMESGLSEALREVLLKKIAVKTKVSLTSIRRDIKALVAPPQFTLPDPMPEGGPGDPDEASSGGDDEAPATPVDMTQPHTTAAQTAVAKLTAMSGAPPAYCFGGWLYWDGAKWARQGLEVEVKREAHRALYNQGTHATAPAIRSVTEIMEAMMAVSPAAFEPSTEEITIFTPLQAVKMTKKGWQIEKPHPRNRNLMTISTSYDPEATAPLWLKTLDDVLTSDQARRTLACSIIYAAAQCRPWLRKAIYLYGPKRSGKSTLLDTVQALLGVDNCSALNMRQLGGRFGGSSLVGKLANISNETVSRDTLQDDIFKALVSGEAVEVERKHQAQFVFHNTAKLFFAANGFPRIKDESDATLDRLTILSCPFSIPHHRADTVLRQKLLRELPGILTWAMEIFTEEYKKDRCISAMEMDEAAEGAMASWKEVNYPALRWVKERTEERPGELLSMDAAYADYRLWCHECGHKEANKIHFSRQVGQRLTRTRPSGQGKTFWMDRRLRPVNNDNFSVLD